MPAAAVVLLLAPSAWAQPATACVDAGKAAAVRRDLPPGLLLAVGKVESGRWDPLLHHLEPWPWVIDVAGRPQFFPDKSTAVETTRALLQTGHRNIDVGCFQISLLHHPLAFTSLDQAFDPAANARYAARFLSSLRNRYGNWADAVAAYHSADPMLGTPYRRSVFSAWQAADGASVALFSSMVPAVHVWTPDRAGTAPQIIRIGAPRTASALPRIVTPSSASPHVATPR